MANEYVKLDEIKKAIHCSADDLLFTADGRTFIDFEIVKEAVLNIPTADVVEVKHGKWEEYLSDKDDYNHHRCSVCKEDAFFEYEYEPEYDEGYDGEWHYIAHEIYDMHEYLSPYCPHCGAKMYGKGFENGNEAGTN